MGRTAFIQPQCLYKGALLPFTPLSVVSVRCVQTAPSMASNTQTAMGPGAPLVEVLSLCRDNEAQMFLLALAQARGTVHTY